MGKAYNPQAIAALLQFVATIHIVNSNINLYEIMFHGLRKEVFLSG